MRKLLMLDRKTLAETVDVSVFEPFGALEIRELTPKEELGPAMEDAEIVIVNKAVLTEKELASARHLKLICLLATGFNNVDVAYCRKRGIGVCNVPDYSTKSVAQHTLALTLALAEHTAFYDAYVKSGHYTESGVPTYHGRPYHELDGKTWGIVGLGHIGQEVARLAEALGCRVIYYSTTGKNHNNLYHSCTFNELLTESDILSLHCALNEQTKELIDAEALAQMKPSALLINVARGQVIDEGALAEALRRGQIRGAGIDVFTKEPPDAEMPLLAADLQDRLVFSPHIAWGSVEAQTRLLQKVCENIRSFDAGERLNRVD